MTDSRHRVAFVCVENAGRSQIAAALAKRELRRRGLGESIGIVSGGTDPGSAVHDTVIEAMAEVGIDIGDATPREISREALLAADVVVTMGCSAGDVCPATWRGDARDWALPDPADEDLNGVRAIRDTIADRVAALVDELAARTTTG